ncbi:MAG: hypothetical protein QGG53_07250, partial [Planctomycetota bacterium]|nr:hypothetical protein [Planctomycetota bacterium]
KPLLQILLRQTSESAAMTLSSKPPFSSSPCSCSLFSAFFGSGENAELDRLLCRLRLCWGPSLIVKRIRPDGMVDSCQTEVTGLDMHIRTARLRPEFVLIAYLLQTEPPWTSGPGNH